MTLFGTHARVVLPCALIGFAGVRALGVGYEALTSHALVDTPALLLVLAFAGWFLNSLARGATTWIGQQNPEAHIGVTASAVTRAVRTHSWPLLAGAVIDAALTFGVAVGLAFILHNAGVVEPASRDPNPGDRSYSVVARSLDALGLAPLHPLAGLLKPISNALMEHSPQWSRVPIELTDRTPYRIRRIYGRTGFAGSAPTGQTAPLSDAPWQWWIILIGLALRVAIESILSFHPATVIHAMWAPARPMSVVHTLVCPSISSVRLAARHWLVVLANTVILRLAVSAVYAVGVMLPFAIGANVVAPQLDWSAHAPWLALACQVAGHLGGAAVAAILAAMCAVFDARLYIGLQRAESDMSVSDNT